MLTLLVLGFVLVLFVGYVVLAITLTANKNTRPGGIVMIVLPVLLAIGGTVVLIAPSDSYHYTTTSDMAPAHPAQSVQGTVTYVGSDSAMMQQQIEAEMDALQNRQQDLREQFDLKMLQFESEIQRLEKAIETKQQEHDAAEEMSDEDATAETKPTEQPEIKAEADPGATVPTVEPVVDEQADETVEQPAEELIYEFESVSE